MGGACWARPGLRITATMASKARAGELCRNKARIRFYAGSETARSGFLRTFTRCRMPLPQGCVPLVRGEVLTGMKDTDRAVAGKVNEPMLPVAWTTTYKGARVFTTTMGSAEDFLNEALRRLFVNAALWAVGREGGIPEKSDVRTGGRISSDVVLRIILKVSSMSDTATRADQPKPIRVICVHLLAINP